MAGELFGRRVRVSIGSQVIVDLDPRESEDINETRNLHVQFSTSTHAKHEPLVANFTVFGLNQDRRRQLKSNQDKARRIAWQEYQAIVVGDILVEPDQIDEVSANLVSQGASVKIEAGYGDDMGVIHRGIILPDGFDDDFQSPGYATKIRSQDNRLSWANTFVSEEVAPGVTLVDYQRAITLQEQYLAGDVGAAEVQAQAPGLLEQKLDVFGYENGKVLHGQSRDESQILMDTLGLRAFVVNGKPYFLPVEATLFTEAVVLQLPSEDPTRPSPGGLMIVSEGTAGWQKIRCLLNYRLSAGRQVRLLDASGRPIGGGLYRVEFAQHSGVTFAVAPYFTDASLRPVTVAPEDNG